MYVAAYFWMASALLAWWRVTVYLLEEAFGEGAAKIVTAFPTAMMKRKPLLNAGLGEPGICSPKQNMLQGTVKPRDVEAPEAQAANGHAANEHASRAVEVQQHI